MKPTTRAIRFWSYLAPIWGGVGLAAFFRHEDLVLATATIAVLISSATFSILKAIEDK